MNGVGLALFWSALILPLAGVAVQAEPAISLPCEPSRACAIEMARAAAYENERRSKGNFGQMSGLLAIADVQLHSGDIPGFTATAAEARRAIDGSNVLRGGLDFLAQMQARAGLFDEALATAGDSRTAIEREMAYRHVSEEFARRGRWREALAARTVADQGHVTHAKNNVMKVLVQTGRREWVLEALPSLGADREAEVLTEFERLSGNLAAAREHAVRITDPEKRWMPLLEIAKAGIENEQWDEVVAVARFAAAEGESADTSDVRHHRVYFAITWLSAARRFDEALSLVPKYREEFDSQVRAHIASDMLTAGELERPRAMLESLSPEYKAEVQGKIAIASVLAGEQRFEKALTVFRTPQERLDALQMLAERLLEARSKEARDVLRAAVKVAEHVEDRDAELAAVGGLQARRGFIADARATAARIEKGTGKYRAINLCRILGEIMKAQAARVDLAGARKTFARTKPLLHVARIDADTQVDFINDLATAGLLPEAFEQVQALSRRAHNERWHDSKLFPLIRAHVEKGQLRRAFEISALVSEHDYGNPEYFLEIAKALVENGKRKPR